MRYIMRKPNFPLDGKKCIRNGHGERKIERWGGGGGWGGKDNFDCAK